MSGMEEEEELVKSWQDLKHCPHSLSGSPDAWILSLHRFRDSVKAMGPSASPLLLAFLRQPDLSDFAMDALAHSIALCCGACSAPPSVLSFTFTSLPVSIKIKEMDYVKGGLGWKVWGAALLLSSRLIKMQKSFLNKRVLELGSGCGLCGLLVAKLGASQVVLSDCVPDILENLCENILLLPAILYRSSYDNDDGECSNTFMNRTITEFDYMYEGIERQHYSHEQSCVVGVRMLDWSQDGSKEMEEEDLTFPRLTSDSQFDWVIGSDLIYDQANIRPLAEVIERRLQKPHGVGFFANPVRETKELDIFLKELDILGMEANVELCTEEEWESCITALGLEKGGATLHGVDHYEGGFVVVGVKRKC